MDRDGLRREIKDLLADVLDIDPDDIDQDTSPDTVEAWDSLAHIRLISAIEEKYSLSLPPEEQVEMLNFELIEDVVAEKLSL